MAVNIKKEFAQRLPMRSLPTLIYGKVPPQASDLEEAVLGACMLERDTFESVMEIIFSPDCFYVDAHQKVFNAMCILYNSGGMVDLLTITDQLRKTNELELIGGASALSKLTMSVLSSGHVMAHAAAVMECFFKREVIRICGQAINDAYDDCGDAFELMERVETEVKSIADGILSDNACPVGVTFNKMLTQIKHQKTLKTDLIGITSGFDELDRLTLGWIETNLIILAARPSVGKTAFAVNFAQNAARRGNATVLMFALESSDISLVRRMAAAQCQIPLEDIRTGRVNDFQEELLIRAASDFNSLSIKIDEKSRKLSDIKKSIRRWAKRAQKGKKKLVIIDYLQLMSLEGKGNREQEISTISRDLVELAKELNLPIIALSQLNREVEKRADKKPNIADLRESGALEQDATIIILPWWEDLSEGGKQLHALVVKNREGQCGDVLLKMNGDFQKIMNMEEFHQNIPPSFISNNQNANTYKKSDWDDNLPFR